MAGNSLPTIWTARYALAGEFAMDIDLAVNHPRRLGPLQVGVLAEVFHWLMP